MLLHCADLWADIEGPAQVSLMSISPKCLKFVSVFCVFLTLHVNHQQCVTNSQRCPKPEGLSGREELLINY